MPVQPAFLDVLGSEYDSGVRQVDFENDSDAARMTINDWVAAETKDKIVDLLPFGSIDVNTRVVLVNALYFYGTWSTPFQPSMTRAATFHRLAGDTIQVPTMLGALSERYGRGTDYEVAELPYEGEHIRMTIVLPTDGQFESVRSQVSAAWFDQVIESLQPAGVLTVRLPKFKFTSGSFSLMTGLRDLGMKLAFGTAADFSGISGDARLMLLDVLQEAYVAVDENGTEASASNAVTAGDTSKPQNFTVDRPFLFFIRDDDGAVMFSGQVTDPSQ